MKSTYTICYEVLREIKREVAHSPGYQGDILVEVHPEVAQLLFEDERIGLEELEQELKRKILIKSDERMHRENVDVTSP